MTLFDFTKHAISAFQRPPEKRFITRHMLYVGEKKKKITSIFIVCKPNFLSPALKQKKKTLIRPRWGK